MDALVCFKIMPELDAVFSGNEPVIENNQIQASHVRQIFNCFDESALELGLGLADQYKETKASLSLTALTIDDTRADLFLRQLLAVQYDTAARIELPDTTTSRAGPAYISTLICRYIQENKGTQIVFTGTQSGEYGDGQTGFLVAERLGWPCISQVSEVQPGPGPDSIIVTTDMQGISVTCTVMLPVVLVVGNAPKAPFLRVPTLSQKLAAKKRAIKILSASELTDSGHAPENSETGFKFLTPVKNEKQCRMIDQGSDAAKARILYDIIINKGQRP